MSDVSLATPAPSGSGEAPTVVADAPASVAGEVTDSSASDGRTPEGFIEKARFDGLMGRLQREINTTAQMQAELEALRSAREEAPVSDPALAQEVQALRSLLLEERAENARKDVLAKYPELTGFADLLIADTPEEMRALAEDFSTRLKQATGSVAPPAAAEETPQVSPPASEAPAADAGASAPVTEAPAAPVVGGGSTFSGEAAVEDRVQEAVKNKDFSSFFRAVEERAVLNAEGVLQ